MRSLPPITYEGACDLIEDALRNRTRTRILDEVQARDDFADAWRALRGAFRSHTFSVGSGEALRLQRIVQSFDTRARRAGLHVLESWDYTEQRFAAEITPVLMFDRCTVHDLPADRQRHAMAVLLDHYFMSVLGLVAARAWDEGDPNVNLTRAAELLSALHGPDGSGCRFVDDVETLLLTCVSHYHPEEHAYSTLVASFDALDEAHRRRMALACAAVLGGHLRWGLQFMYRRDIGLMRDDNVVDYPFVVFALVTLLREYSAMQSAGTADDDRSRIVEGILSALSADPLFAVGRTPAWLADRRDDHVIARDMLLGHRGAVLEDIRRHQPSTHTYSPLGFDANFLCNTVVAMVATELREPGPHPSLNVLFTRHVPSEVGLDGAERHARALMRYALGNRVAASQAPLITYDPYSAAHSYNMTVAALNGVS